ncbi:hypothetical protein [Streptomyces sp. NPDC001914]|uniref:hypothetical protein n=1 Tax=Streptomyces sp. NPDC001914 TaxID=3364623 RepID=UPI003687A105
MNRDQAYQGRSVMWGTVLPSRVAYLIESGSADGFRTAVQTSSARWGGVCELIIEVDPLSGVSAAAHDLAGRASLEAAVRVDVAVESAVAAAEYLNLPLIDLEDIETDPRTAYSYPLTAVAGGDPLLVAQENGPIWQVAAAGDVTDQRSFRPWVRRPRDGSEIGFAQDRPHQTLLEDGSWQFEEHATDSIENTSAVIWLVSETHPVPDCIEFWNLRALSPRARATRIPVLLIPYPEVEAWHAYDQHVRGLLGRPGDRSVDVVLRSHSVPEPEIHRIASSWGLEELPGDSISFGLPAPWAGGATRSAPFTYRIGTDPSPWLAARRQWGRQQDLDVHVFLDRPTGVRFRSPVSLSQPAQVLVRLAGEALDGLPRHPQTASSIHPQARWHGAELEIGVVTDNDVVLELNIPSLEDATMRLLNSLTEKWELSDKGRLGAAMQAQEAPAALLEPGLYDVVMQLFTPRSKELAKELKRAIASGSDEAAVLELARSWGGRARRRYRKVADINLPGLPAAELSERLCALGWAERGLETVCARCGEKSFVPLLSSTPDASCPGCATPARYTADKNGPLTHYRLDTFVDQAADQGVLPHLMAIGTLHRAKPHSSFLPGANLWVKGHPQREVDIIGTLDGRILAGEVKTSPGDFTAEQIAHDIATSASIGADIHLMAAIHPISETSRELAEAQCTEHNMKLLVLDNLREPTTSNEQ